MSWWGKVIGGAFGFMLGGPLGALIGAALGHNFDRGLDGIERDPPGGGDAGHERTQLAFFTATFSVMGHVAKADGRVTPDEIRLAAELMDHMNLTPEMRRVAQRLFNEGKAADFPVDDVLDQFRTECQRSRNLKRVFIEIQLQAAYADGDIHRDERRILEHATERIGFSRSELHEVERLVVAGLRFRRGWSAGDPGPSAEPPIEDAYRLLGVAPDCSDDEVKRAYRRLMNQHHPDKLVAKGLPEEMMKLATEKTQEIRAAYERIRAARKNS